jgi:hypothetical protein
VVYFKIISRDFVKGLRKAVAKTHSGYPASALHTISRTADHYNAICLVVKSLRHIPQPQLQYGHTEHDRFISNTYRLILSSNLNKSSVAYIIPLADRHKAKKKLSPCARHKDKEGEWKYSSNRS